MNSSHPSLPRRWLVLLLAGLLALAPFLHSHFGASHDTGFHLDGVHAVHAAQGHASNLQASDEESPALGVAASLPHSEDDGLPDLGWALPLALLPLLPKLHRNLPRACRILPQPAALYCAGLPPPSLAPPAA